MNKLSLHHDIKFRVVRHERPLRSPFHGRGLQHGCILAARTLEMAFMMTIGSSPGLWQHLKATLHSAKVHPYHTVANSRQ